MPIYEITHKFSNSGSRDEVRMRVVNELSQEKCGNGKGKLATKYIYYVETLSDGRRVFLRRPAFLHVGFDFVVCVEKVNFNPNGRRRDYPKHDDILNDLRAKRAESERRFTILMRYIADIYACKDVDFSQANSIGLNSGLPADMILAVLKWLFIEQDIRYWNYSGREMLWSAIISI